MIARVWRGWADPETAADYQLHFETEVITHLRDTPGFVSARLLRRDEIGTVEFTSIALFTDMTAIRAFAGEDPGLAVLQEAARQALSRWDDRVAHHEVTSEVRLGADLSAGTAASPGLTALDHVGIAVPDLDAAITFYRDVLGMRLLHTEINQAQGVREAMLAVGDGPACVQLLAPLTPESTVARFLERSGPGLQQLAFRVADVRTAADALRAAGLRLTSPAPQPGTAGSLVNFVHPKDTGGVLIELVQPGELGSQSTGPGD